MAKKFSNKKEKADESQFPSRFGSHATMATVSDVTTREVLCIDEKGEYWTKQECLDSGLADPNRHNWQGRGVA